MSSTLEGEGLDAGQIGWACFSATALVQNNVYYLNYYLKNNNNNNNNNNVWYLDDDVKHSPLPLL